MSPLKQLLLGLYYHASYPVRAWERWLDAAEERVADRGVLLPSSGRRPRHALDGLQRHVSPANRLAAEAYFPLVSLEEAQRRIRRGYNCEPCVSVTFDDGYADNCRQAIPWLIKERIPCTYFVTVRNLLEGAAFEHDLARGQRCRPNTPEQIALWPRPASKSPRTATHTPTLAR